MGVSKGVAVIAVIALVTGPGTAAPKKTSARPIKPPAVTVREPPPRLFDFKGVPLDISMDEFRATPHPDGETARVVCTGEKVGRYNFEPTEVMLFDNAERAAGVQKCIWVPTVEKLGISDIAPLKLADTGYVLFHYSFSFIRDPKDGVMRLFKIDGDSNIAAFDGVVAALTSKFGKPMIEAGKVQNKIGNSFDQTTASWTNSLGSIVVQSRYLKIDDFGIVITSTRLSSIVQQERAQQAAKQKNPI